MLGFLKDIHGANLVYCAPFNTDLIMAKTTFDIDKLTPYDMANIYSAFQTAEFGTYLHLLDSRPKRDWLIPEWFKYICNKVNLDKYIEHYLSLPEGKARDGFWLNFK